MSGFDHLKSTYFEECGELLDAAYRHFAALEDDSPDPDTVHAIFRAIHSIKGGGGAFGFERLVAFAHLLETVLDLLRDGRLPAIPPLLSLLVRATDALGDLVEAARTGTDAPPGFEAGLMAALREAAAPEGGVSLQPAAAAMAPAATKPAAAMQRWRIRLCPPPRPVPQRQRAAADHPRTPAPGNTGRGGGPYPTAQPGGHGPRGGVSGLDAAPRIRGGTGCRCGSVLLRRRRLQPDDRAAAGRSRTGWEAGWLGRRLPGRGPAFRKCRPVRDERRRRPLNPRRCRQGGPAGQPGGRTGHQPGHVDAGRERPAARTVRQPAQRPGGDGAAFARVAGRRHGDSCPASEVGVRQDAAARPRVVRSARQGGTAGGQRRGNRDRQDCHRAARRPADASAAQRARPRHRAAGRARSGRQAPLRHHSSRRRAPSRAHRHRGGR